MGESAKEVEPQKRNARVNSLTRVVQILDYLVQEQEPQSPFAISKATKAPVSTIYSTIDEMEKHGLLRRKKDGTVWIGEHLYYYGVAYSAKLDFFEEAKKEILALRDLVREDVQICGRDNTSLVVMDMVAASQQFRFATNTGTRLPLNWTASGLLLVGHMPDEERLRILTECVRESPTGKAETDPDVLSKAARDCYQNRLAIQGGLADDMVCCIASPISNDDGECLATISVVLPDAKAKKNPDYYAEHVKQAALNIERRMGWQNP